MDTNFFKETKVSMLNTVEESLKSCISLIRSLDYDQQEKEHDFNNIKNLTKELCEKELDFERVDNAWKKTSERSGNVEQYNQILENEPTHSFEAHAIWHSISRLLSPDEADTDVELSDDNDESIHCSETFTVPVDPLGFVPIKNPYRSTICKHVYEYDTIMRHLSVQHRGRKVCCPYVGCVKALKKNDLQPDPQLKAKIESHNK